MLYTFAQVVLTLLLVGIGIEAKRIVDKNEQLTAENEALKAQLS